MTRLPSSKTVIDILTKNGFMFVSQRGSHGSREISGGGNFGFHISHPKQLINTPFTFMPQP